MGALSSNRQRLDIAFHGNLSHTAGPAFAGLIFFKAALDLLDQDQSLYDGLP
ncbi:hypothetical protein FHS30_002143 [Simiduia aestuariiviva]|uniref:Uncharacterized protein n=1 Tax=Simiduia aestuariiviva TaxID=1510459 RepID=A0A839UU97_9GAMM|nr:hypothetical protein [Simiduia aestuariiviva]